MVEIGATNETDDLRAYITYLANDLFLGGAVALKLSLDHHRCSFPAVCMITEDVSDSSRGQLESVGYDLVDVEWISSTRTDLKGRYRDNNRVMFTKLNMFLLPYETITYLDADVIVCENIDDIFDFAAPAAVYDANALDRSNRGINAGVMVQTPSMDTFESLLSQIDDYGGNTDQTLMQRAMEFAHIPKTYNTLYKQLGAFGRIKCFVIKPKIIHFNGTKPWIHSGPLKWRPKRFDGAYQEYLKVLGFRD